MLGYCIAATQDPDPAFVMHTYEYMHVCVIFCVCYACPTILCICLVMQTKHECINGHYSMACDMPHTHTHTHRQCTLDWLSIVADLVCCKCFFKPVESTYQAPPGGCWVCQQPPFSQQLPVLTFWLFFYADSFGLWYVQAITQSPPMHPLNRFCDIFQCKRSGCNHK